MPGGFSRLIFSLVFPVLMIIGGMPAVHGSDDENLAIRYRIENNIPMHYQLIQTNNTYSLLFFLEFPPDTDIRNTYDLSYEIRDEFGGSGNLMTRTFYFSTSGIGEEGNIKYFRIDIAEQENFNLLFLRLKNKLSSIEHVWEIPLKGEETYEPPDFYLSNSRTDIPWLYPYIETGDDLQIKTEDPDATAFYVYHYDHTFSPADPPMYRIDKDVSRSLEVDTFFSIAPGESFKLDRKGLYFIQSDTTSFAGISIRAEEKFFPKLVTMDDIVDPVIYLTTKQEIEKLKSAEDKKEAFEKFWLNLSVSEETASRMIRVYFTQVENANRLFTNYKPGWKTDMGMIYIIFGPPDEVTDNGETETWRYLATNNNLPVVFNFLKLKSIFTHQHYLLIRDKQYRNSWYRKIEDWRRGRINR